MKTANVNGVNEVVGTVTSGAVAENSPQILVNEVDILSLWQDIYQLSKKSTEQSEELFRISSRVLDLLGSTEI